jgi:hypothetical protein
MIRVLLIAVLALVIISAAAILAAVIQGKRVKKAAAEAERLHDAFWEIQKRAERLRKALGENARAEEKADEERKGLAGTPDAGLAGRANGLFNGGERGGEGSGTVGSGAAGAEEGGDGKGKL